MSPALRACLAAAALALLPSALPAQIISIPFGGPKKEKPSPNADLLGAPADVARAIADKAREPALRDLDETRHPAEVLAYFGLTRGQRVLVVETPLPGYWAELIGAAMGSGRVTELVAPATMTTPALAASLSAAVALAPNMSLLTATPAAARLAPASLDFVLLDDAAGIEVAAAVLPKLAAAVRPGGTVGVIGGRDPVAIAKAFGAAGFVLDRSGQLRDAPPGAAAIQQFHKPDAQQ